MHLGTFLGVKFGLKDLICVKNQHFASLHTVEMESPRTKLTGECNLEGWDISAMHVTGSQYVVTHCNKL